MSKKNFTQDKKSGRVPYIRDKAPIQKRNNIFDIPFIVTETNEQVIDDIYDNIEYMRFDKISVPLNIYRAMFDKTCDDDKVFTAGYIKGYDAETEKFKVVVYNNFLDIFENNEMCMIANVSQRGNHLSCITKFIATTTLPEEEIIED